MAPQAITPTGGGTPVNNMQPYLTLNFCIAMVGIYPLAALIYVGGLGASHPRKEDLSPQRRMGFPGGWGRG